MQDIGKAMTEFSKANNYHVIFDGEKMESTGLIQAVGDSVDVTAAVIKYYNARPGL
jgi:Skp family chaperone for outer membrane proteins